MPEDLLAEAIEIGLFINEDGLWEANTCDVQWGGSWSFETGPHPTAEGALAKLGRWLDGAPKEFREISDGELNLVVKMGPR